MPGLKWTINWNGHSYTEDDLLGSDLAMLALLLGPDWSELNPAKSPLHLMSFLAVFEARATGAEPAKVYESIQQTPASKLLDALQLSE